MLTAKQMAMDLTARLRGQTPKPATENVEKIDTSASQMDVSGSDYGVFDTRTLQPEERMVKIPLGKTGLVQVYYNPLTKVCRPIPKVSA